ncbi:MAG: ECF transporter S component [Clostridiales bacterium]|nr:ECF transporter S component [Clostridiales bacterium]
MKTKALKYLVVLGVMVTIIFGLFVSDNNSYALVSLVVVIISCVPIVVHFEKGKSSTRLIVLISTMVAISVAGRFLFAPIPFFKPVTAIVVLCGIYLGSESGFLVGGLSALISNFYFGQGPWTPFQMLAWGLIGFLAGIMANPLKRSKIFLCIYGFISGIVYSLILDSWSTLWIEGYFSVKRFLALSITALPITLCYAISNVIFLLIIGKPLGSVLERIIKKYGILSRDRGDNFGKQL